MRTSMFGRMLKFGLPAFVLLSLLAGCGMLGGPTAQPTEPPPAFYTQAAGTIVADLTQNAPTATPTLSATEPPLPTETQTAAPAETDTPVPPTATAEISPTLMVSPTLAITATASASPTPSVTLQEVFRDDFASGRGWFTERKDDYGFAFRSDAFRIYVGLNDAVWNVRSQEFGDVSVSADVSRVQGDSGSYYGVICRHVDAGSYYAFVINNDGYYGIAKRQAGEMVFLTEGKAQEGVIQPGNAANNVRGDCLDNSLVLYVNNVRLAEVQDGDYNLGSTGLVAGNRPNGQYTDVLFDNFVLAVPLGQQ